MQDRIFGDREKAMEEAYFRGHDAKLIDKIRQRARLDEIATALGEKLQVDNPDLLLKVRDLGVTLDTAPAFLLAPVIQVAWAEGKVTRKEHQAVLHVAEERGVEPGTTAHAQLEEWLRVPPSDEFFDTAIEVLKVGFGVLPASEREERTKDVIEACREVARSSASVGRIIGLTAGVVPVEILTLDHIAEVLRNRE